MFLVTFFTCRMGFHRPRRREVDWDGRTYVGHCRHCNRPIERISRRTWRSRSI